MNKQPIETIDDLSDSEMLDAVSAYTENRNNPQSEGWIISSIEDGYFDPITEEPDTARIEREIEKYRAKIAIGKRLFDDGWRVATTERHVVGHAVLDPVVPDKAVVFRRVPAGYLAQSPCYRFEYLYKKGG